MRSQRQFVDYIQDILDAIEKVEQFTEGMDFKGFSVDDKTVFAVIRALEVIGEASKRIPEDFRKLHPKIPWKQMAGMRDKVIHAYFGVDAEVVWSTVERDLPTLAKGMQAILDSLGD